jgi:arsenate reductase
MAEGLTNHFLGDSWEAFSAGTEPTGYVHSLAVEAMAELGVSLDGHTSKSVMVFRERPFDLVVTVCDSAAESCPVWLGSGKVKHISFPDPAKARGSHDEKMRVFRQVREDMQQKVLAYLQNQ